MADRLLTRNDRGPDVQLAQGLLNREGALLDEDGVFGGGTETAVRDCQTRHDLPVTGQVDSASWAVLHGLPEPSPDIATRAITFICQQEVSSRAHYDAVVARPSFPGGESGITIGIGYDLRFAGDTFEADWGSLLTTPVQIALRPSLGQQGSSQAAQALAHIAIAWDAAWTVFVRRSLPQTVAATRSAFPGLDSLPPLSRGALVSLVYNRGASMGTPAPNDSRLEMREIRAAIAARDFARVPELLRAMKRLWPTLRGLRDRRDGEATLFQDGLLGAAADG